MHLYTQSASPNGQRVEVFLKEKGADIAKTQIDLRAGENLGEEFLARNPFGRVPTLELDDGTYLSESLAICRYLEGLYPEPNLFGATPQELAVIEMWSGRVEIKFMVPVAQCFRNSTGFFKDREKCSAEWGQISGEIARDAATLLDKHLANSRYLIDDRYSVADITLAITIGFARNVGQDYFDLPNLARFHAEVTSRPAFQ